MAWFGPITAAALGGASVWLAVQYRRAQRTCQELSRQMSEGGEQLASLQHQLHVQEELARAKDEFISTVSHELRTPLTSIRGALGLLSAGVGGSVDAKAANLLRIASSNTDRLVRLLNDILDLERMDSGRAPMQLRPCAVRELLMHPVETMRALAEATGVHLELAPEPAGLPSAIEADADRIEQVLVNLLSNAIKFSPEGSRVRVHAGYDADAVLIRIEDAGRGVPEEKLESIFARFSQVEAADARVKGGTGLGLAICRSIIAQHHGAVWAERNDAHTPGDAGMTFVVRLPRSPEAERSVRQDHAPQRPCMLVVESDPGFRDLLGDRIAAKGYHVLPVATAEQAVSACHTEPVDAIVLQLALPDGDGLTLLEWFRQHPALGKVPTVLYSSRDLSVPEREQLRLRSNHLLARTRAHTTDAEDLAAAAVRHLHTAALQAAC